MTHAPENDTVAFLTKLEELAHILPNNEDSEWTLVFVDCDDVQTLIQQNHITTENVQNSINFLQQTIDTLITKKNKDNYDMFGYHLGGDLFAFFINDSYSMDKSQTIVQNLIKTMQNKDKSSLTISAGVGIRTLAKSTNETKTDENINDDDAQEFDFKNLQREWVLRAYINLLRAKENGKNCYFCRLVC